MMKSRIIALLVCLFLGLPASSFAERMTDNWKLTGYTKHRDAVFADMARLSSPAPGVTSVWIKIAPSSRSHYLQAIQAYLASVKKQDQGFKSIEILCDVKCNDHLLQITRFVYLDTDRNVIHETYESNLVWMKINQGSIWYPVEKAACGTAK